MTRDLRPIKQMVEATLSNRLPEEGVAGNVSFFTQRRRKPIAPRGAVAESWFADRGVHSAEGPQ